MAATFFSFKRSATFQASRPPKRIGLQLEFLARSPGRDACHRACRPRRRPACLLVEHLAQLGQGRVERRPPAGAARLLEGRPAALVVAGVEQGLAAVGDDPHEGRADNRCRGEAEGGVLRDRRAQHGFARRRPAEADQGALPGENAALRGDEHGR